MNKNDTQGMLYIAITSAGAGQYTCNKNWRFHGLYRIITRQALAIFVQPYHCGTNKQTNTDANISGPRVLSLKKLTKCPAD